MVMIPQGHQGVRPSGNSDNRLALLKMQRLNKKCEQNMRLQVQRPHGDPPQALSDLATLANATAQAGNGAFMASPTKTVGAWETPPDVVHITEPVLPGASYYGFEGSFAGYSNSAGGNGTRRRAPFDQTERPAKILRPNQHGATTTRVTADNFPSEQVLMGDEISTGTDPAKPYTCPVEGCPYTAAQVRACQTALQTALPTE
jgi:hypothetical protein